MQQRINHLKWGVSKIDKNTYQERVTRLRQRLKADKLDAFLISRGVNQSYFEGFSGGSGFLLITDSSNYMFVDSRYTEQAEKECQSAQIIPCMGECPSFAKGIASVCSALSVSTLGFESDALFYSQYQEVAEALHQVKLVPTKEIGALLRLIKTEQEIQCIEEACRIADRALEKLLPKIAPGISERALASELEGLMVQEGGEGISFDTIVAFGTHTSLPHAKPRVDAYLQKGDLILIDYGCCYKGYHSDSTRTFVCGPATREQKSRYALVLEAHRQAVVSLVPGIRIDSAQYAALATLAAEGYLEGSGAYQHALGHGVGLDIHELPVIRAGASTLLQEGQVLTIEPGLYLPGWGGIRIEDTLAITETGARSLVRFPKDRLLELG